MTDLCSRREYSNGFAVILDCFTIDICHKTLKLNYTTTTSLQSPLGFHMTVQKPILDLFFCSWPLTNRDFVSDLQENSKAT